MLSPVGKFGKIPDGVAQLERDGHHCPNNIFDMYRLPDYHSTISRGSQIRIFSVCYRTVSLITSWFSLQLAPG